MAREYAVIRESGTKEVLFQTPSFSFEHVTDEIPFTDGAVLLVCEETEPEITTLKRELEDAREENRAKETFLSNMSHDIRTPMNAIVGMTALAKKHIDEKRRVSDALDKIEVASGHLLSLINEVLDMSRINSGRMKIAQEDFALGDLLHETLVLTRPMADEKKHTLSFSTGKILHEMLAGDALRIRQILVNIISNAVKYTPDGGTIDVSVSESMQDDLCVFEFTCSDNGIGMSEEFLNRIFDPFERANSTTVSRIEGTGLGMSIVKKLVESMNGEIRVKSVAGEGTSVTVRIPLPFKEFSVQSQALSGRHILILESDPELLMQYRAFLEGTGAVLTFAKGASDAIGAITDSEFRGQAFDLAVIGNKPELEGTLYEFSNYIRRLDPELGIVLVSEANWEEIEYHAIRSGIDRFIPIPFFQGMLINGLSQTLQHATEQEGSSDTPDLTGKRILLVEDNFINREIALEILSTTGAMIETAENGEEAVEKYIGLPSGTFDLILMDVQMPVMDGYTATAKIRASGREDADRILIWAMTANTFAEDIAKATETGMNGHIAKPIDVTKLMNTLRRII